MGELEASLAECNKRWTPLAKQVGDEPRPWPRVVPLLDRVPILADKLADMPQPELRPLFDQLQLDIAYHPAEAPLDVASTLHAEGITDGDATSVAGLVSAPGRI